MTRAGIFKKGMQLTLSQDMAYKWNFLITVIATMFKDFIGPLIIILIYTSTSGIPGWSLYEFLLFQGTLTLVFGFGHFAFVQIPAKVISGVRRGTFDKYLLKPVDTLFYLTAIATDWDGLGQVAVGLALIIFAFIKLNLAISLNFWIYVLLILVAFIFQYAIMVLISALTFLIVQSWALLDLFFKISDFARYPSSVYGVGLRFMLTFFFPIAISAYYPSIVLINGFSIKLLLEAVIPVFVFFILSLYVWKLAMRKYTSAGG